MSLRAILESVERYQVKYITVTGGEPLAQPGCLPLLEAACDLGYSVSLETGGALSTEGIDRRVSTVLDLKTPASGECARNDYDNIARLGKQDQVKFVICDRADYEWSRSKIIEFQLDSRAGEVLFSPSFGQLGTRDLAEWILEDRLPVRMQLQLHKQIWGDSPGH